MPFQTSVMLVLSAFIPWNFVSCLHYDTYKRNTDCPGQALFNKHLLDNVYTVSRLDCARLCSEMMTCFGHAFNTTDSGCKLRSLIDDAKTDGMTEHPFVSYTGTEVTPCGEAPDVDHAMKDTKGYSVGAVAIYTCNSDFLQCPKKTIQSVCQSSGEWKEVTEMCEQFRWRNQNVTFKQPLPCGSGEQFTVKCRLTPTKNTYFNVIIAERANFLMMVEFRLKHKRTRNIMVLNSKIDGKWKARELGNKKRLNMTPGEELSILFTWNQRFYKIEVSGTVRKYRSPRNTRPPETFGIGGDVTIHLVEMMPERRH